MNRITKKHCIHISRTFWFFCLVFISIGSILPGSPRFQLITANDKLLHTIAYAAWAVLPPLFLPKRRPVLPWALSMVAWGVLLEGAQGFVPHRTPSFWDFVANTTGVVLGTWAGLLARKRLYRNTHS